LSATATASRSFLQELLLVSSDLSVFGRYTAFNTQPGPENSVSASFKDIVFPKGGQYVLVFDGELPLPGAAAADGSQQQMAVSTSTFIGVGALPANIIGPQYNGSRAGLKEIIVHGGPLQQQQSRSIWELLQTEDSHAAASSGSNGTSHTAYRVVLDVPDQCAPGQPATYTWTLRDASSGEPVTDLQPHNGTALRLFIAIADLSHMQQTAGSALPSTAAGRASSSQGRSSGRSSLGGGASAYMRGRKVAAGATVAEVAVAGNSSAVRGSNAQPQQQQQLGGRRLLERVAKGAALRQLQQTGSDAASAGSSSKGGQFGPSVSAQVVLPKYGTYLFVAEVMRGGDEFVVMPFYVSCSTGDPQLESAAANARTSGAAGVAVQQPLRIMLLWAVLALMLQHLLL
jgi:hypothetical protein